MVNWTRLNDALNKSTQPTTDWFKPRQEDRTVIRILPGIEGKPTKFDLWHHWNVIERGTVFCLGRRCPVCQIARVVKLRGGALPDGEAKDKLVGRWGIHRKLKVANNLGLNVLPRVEGQEPQVQIWSTPPSVSWFIKDAIQDVLNGDEDFTHPETGYDLIVGYYPISKKKRPNDIYKPKFAKQPSPIGWDEWPDHVFDLREKMTGRVENRDEADLINVLRQTYEDAFVQYGLGTVEELLEDVGLPPVKEEKSNEELAAELAKDLEL